MYSASLYKEDFLKIKRLVKSEDVKLVRRLEESYGKQLFGIKAGM